MLLRITAAEVVGRSTLRLTFNDGEKRIVNAAPLFNGPIFDPLRDPAIFATAGLDPVSGTVIWPNGADFAPEALYAASDASDFG